MLEKVKATLLKKLLIKSADRQKEILTTELFPPSFEISFLKKNKRFTKLPFSYNSINLTFLFNNFKLELPFLIVTNVTGNDFTISLAKAIAPLTGLSRVADGTIINIFFANIFSKY